MRKLKYSIPILLLSLALAFCLFSCKKSETRSFSASFNGAILSWEKVANASYYTVDCVFPDGTGYTVSTKELSYACPQSAAGDYLYAVTALSASKKVVARSEKLVYHLGKGSYADPCLISGADELKAIGSGSTEAAFGTVKYSVPLHYSLQADIDLSGETWTPIGNTSSPFLGVFDGNGHKITGLSITSCNADARIGFFGSIKNAVVRNVVLEGASLVFDKKSGASGKDITIGLLCGHSYSSVFDNCRVTGSVEVLRGISTTGQNTMHVGGVLGKMESGKLFKCSFDGEIFAQYSSVNVGGILGQATNASPAFIITNCSSAATVEGVATGYNLTSQTSTAVARVGVFAGALSGSGTTTNWSHVASCVAIGSAAASTTRDGTSESSITSGVFGNTAGSSSINTVPIYNLFYSASVPQVSGTRAKLGTRYTAYPLTDEEFADKEKYRVGESYALDFDEIWEMGETRPVLREKSVTPDPLPLMLTVRQLRGGEVELEKTFNLNDAFNPSFYALTIKGLTSYHLGYHLNTLLNTIGADIATAESVAITADGNELHAFPVTDGAFSSTYFVFGAFDAYEMPASAYQAYQIIDAASLTVYDDVAAKNLTITIACPKKESEEKS